MSSSTIFSQESVISYHLPGPCDLKDNPPLLPQTSSLCLQSAPPCAPLGLAAACSTYDVLIMASDQPSKRRAGFSQVMG